MRLREAKAFALGWARYGFGATWSRTWPATYWKGYSPAPRDKLAMSSKEATINGRAKGTWTHLPMEAQGKALSWPQDIPGAGPSHTNTCGWGGLSHAASLPIKVSPLHSLVLLAPTFGCYNTRICKQNVKQVVFAQKKCLFTKGEDGFGQHWKHLITRESEKSISNGSEIWGHFFFFLLTALLRYNSHTISVHS